MPNEYNKILKYCHDHKSINVPFVIYYDFETILKKTTICYDKSEASYTIEINTHAACSFLGFFQYSNYISKNEQHV